MVGEYVAVGLGSVLRAAIGVVDTTLRRLPCSESRLQRRNGNAGIDRTADRVANYAARPGIKDSRQIDEARRNRDVGNIRDPELVRAIDDPVAGKVREDRAVVIAVSRGNKPPPALGLQVLLAHQTTDLLGINDYPSMAKLCANAAIAISLKLIADHSHSRHDLPITGFHRCCVVIG